MTTQGAGRESSFSSTISAHADLWMCCGEKSPFADSGFTMFRVLYRTRLDEEEPFTAEYYLEKDAK